MRLLPLLLLALALAAVAVAPLATAGWSGMFTTPDGVSRADVTLTNVCGSSSTLTVALTPLTPGGPTGTRSVAVKNLRVPDPCTIFCADCPFAWSWTLLGAKTELAGEGVAPGGFTLQGAFQEGVLEFGVTVAG